MSEAVDDLQAKARLERISKWVHEQIHEVIMDKLHDSISVDEVMHSEKMAKSIVLGWFQRITNEIVSEDLGPEAMDQFFENSYYQIAAGKLGTESFDDELVPHRVRKKWDKVRAG